MRARLISRKESHTYVVEMDSEFAQLLFASPNVESEEELKISIVIRNAMRNAIQIGNLQSLWDFLSGK